jgi:hypothetical protein
MANDEHVAQLNQGVAAWNAWRKQNPEIRPDLSRWDLAGANLNGVNLVRANLNGTYLVGASLENANLTGSHLKEANLTAADLSRADLTGASLGAANLNHTKLWEAKLLKANLINASLVCAKLNKAILSGADLSGAGLVMADLTDADLTGCRVYGVSAWDLKLDKAKQQNLLITGVNQPAITVDNIEVAQFVYLMLRNEKIRNVIDTITSKVVLILGRFKKERKAVLDALREELRKRDYVPILFDFDSSATRDITETITLLARMARFIIADLTDPSSIPKELEAIVPDLAVPVQPLLEGASQPFAMFKDYWKYDWVLPIYWYEGLEPLLATLAENVIAPAEARAKALEERRRKFEAQLRTQLASP